MRGLLSGIKRMEIHDGDGLRTTVFFKGCPLKSIWCHNPESISFQTQVACYEEKCVHCGACQGIRSEGTAADCPVNALVLYGREYEAEELAEILLQDEVFFRNSGGGVTLSGGECLAQPEFAAALAEALWKRKISVYVDTCGFVSREALVKIIPFTDVFLYDIKAVDPLVHKRCTGQDNQLILDNLHFLSENDCYIEIRYPLVKGFNDGECDKIGQLLKGMKGIRKIKVLQYHSLAASRYRALDMPNTLPNTETTFQDVEKAVAILQSYGLPAVNGIIAD